MSEFKIEPNSYKYKEQVRTGNVENKDTEKKEIEKITKGEVKVKKKSVISKDLADVKDYVVKDVLIPSGKNVVSDIATAILLSVVASVCACGASGVPGGSLMLIPLACGLFGIDGSVAMQVVAVGFIIGVLQDSAETALNSSSDVLFTAAACMRAERKDGDK